MEIATVGESIFYVKQLLPSELCGAIIEEYSRDPRKHDGYAVSGRSDYKSLDAVKVSTDLGLEPEGAWAQPYTALHSAVSRAVSTLAAEFPSLQVFPLRCTGYKIQHYRRNEGHFDWHFDALGPGAWERQLAMVIYLNSVHDGGETCFHRQNLKLKPVAGDAVFFPTFWTHMHRGETPRSEDKYVISSFVCFAIPAAGQTPS
jgi:2OG-Fe(II) oxygenase superfamily